MFQSRRVMLLVPFAIAPAFYFAPALACSPPQRPVEIEIAELATPTAVGFELSGDYFDEPVATLTGPDGDIGGELARTEEVYDLFVFRPATPLEAGEYDLTVNVGTETTATGSVLVGDPATEIAVNLSGGILESSIGSTCCSTGEPEGACIGSCVDTCNSCWPAGYSYSRTVDVAVSVGGPAIIRVELSPDNGDPSARPATVAALGGGTGVDLRYGEPDAAETCVDVTAWDLDGVEIAREQHCLDAAEFPAIEAREPDEPEAVALCASPPEDESDLNWQRYGLGGAGGTNNNTGGTNNNTAGTNNTTGPDGTKGEVDGGCSVTGLTPGSPTLLLSVLGILGLRHRR